MGPVVRISPYEVHISDPEFIDQVYPGSAVRTEKYPWSQKMFGLQHGFFVTIDHDLHRIRRNAFAHYLSKASLQKLEPGIQSVVDTMVRRLHEVKGTGKIINCKDLFGCLTGDVIGQYAFAQAYNFLEDPDFSPHWHQVLMDVSMNSHVLKQFSIMLPMMKAMPRWMVKLTTPNMVPLLKFQEAFRTQVINAKRDIAEGRKPIGQTNIFYDVLTNPEVHPSIKETDYLQDEAQTIIGAGTVTTGHILSLLHFYILDNPRVQQKLQAELGALMADHPTPKWSQLEQLPYLSACITEGLRIGYGVSHRMQRLFPDTVLRHGDIAIPTMTAVSMTSVLIHDNPSLFPEPRTFKPERFIENPGMRRYLIPFSRGTRQCAGLNMAYAEFYLGIAAVWAPGSGFCGRVVYKTNISTELLNEVISRTQSHLPNEHPEQVQSVCKDAADLATPRLSAQQDGQTGRDFLPSTSNYSFFSLPPELRNQIYEYLIPIRIHISATYEVEDHRRTKPWALIRVFQQFRAGIHTIVYPRTPIDIHLSNYEMKMAFDV
ncbi:MAG: hypothetical protein Q9209_001097 [Squamulea sp. 1 TL-2023]